MAESTSGHRKGNRRKLNKSAAIRDYLQQHPDAGPTEVARKLTEQRIRVSATHVSNVKARLASGAAVGTRGVGRPRKVTTGSVSIETLVEVKKIVDRIGSVEMAQKALHSLSRLI